MKVILAGDCASAEEAIRFFREAETVAKLRQPQIIQVYHPGDYEDRPAHHGTGLAAPQPSAAAARATPAARL